MEFTELYEKTHIWGWHIEYGSHCVKIFHNRVGLFPSGSLSSGTVSHLHEHMVHWSKRVLILCGQNLNNDELPIIQTINWIRRTVK